MSDARDGLIEAAQQASIEWRLTHIERSET